MTNFKSITAVSLASLGLDCEQSLLLAKVREANARKSRDIRAAKPREEAKKCASSLSFLYYN